MNHFLNTSWMPLLSDLVLQSTLLLLLSAALATLARKAPAMRHRISVLTCVGLLTLPLFAEMGTDWKVAVLPGSAAVAPPIASVSLGINNEASARTRQPATPEQTQTNALAVSPTGAVPNGSKRVGPFTVYHPKTWSQLLTEILPLWLFVAWIGGSVLVLTRMGLGFAAVIRLQRSCRRPDAGLLSEQCAQTAQELGITHPVSLYLAPNGILSMPMMWGWRSPRVLLPDEATKWSSERLRSVLLHELSHIRRGD